MYATDRQRQVQKNNIIRIRQRDITRPRRRSTGIQSKGFSQKVGTKTDNTKENQEPGKLAGEAARYLGQLLYLQTYDKLEDETRASYPTTWMHKIHYGQGRYL
eukprot:GHVN01027814.1.p2 GENE.GHVN01027814.1~~GHVN01027814.1.p2  ORF type:complete len:103 (+),score=0.13 GHVN01027814.1:943-1251(+)